MLHDPCNIYGSRKRLKKKHFPREFQENILHSCNGFSLYRCRNDGFKFELDNRSVASYSPLFLVNYGGHCNIEISAYEKPVKYISKYVHRCHDRVTVNISGQNNTRQTHRDETENCINGRYVSLSEAV